MKRVMEKLEHLLKLGGIRKDIVLLVVSGIAVPFEISAVSL